MCELLGCLPDVNVEGVGDWPGWLRIAVTSRVSRPVCPGCGGGVWGHGRVEVERNQDDLDELIADNDDIAIAAITVAEINAGIQLATPSRRPQRQAYVDEIVGLIPIRPKTKPSHCTTPHCSPPSAGPGGLEAPTTSSSPPPP